MPETTQSKNGTTTVYNEENKPTHDGELKTYRVVLLAQVLVDLDVEAENEDQAKAKAGYWKCVGACGKSPVGYYVWFDDGGKKRTEDCDGELSWEIVAEDEYHEVRRVAKLDDVDDEFLHGELTT